MARQSLSEWPSAFLIECRTVLRMFEDTECPVILKRRLAAILRMRCDAYLEELANGAK